LKLESFSIKNQFKKKINPENAGDSTKYVGIFQFSTCKATTQSAEIFQIKIHIFGFFYISRKILLYAKIRR
jgi:hypothetical protein